MVGQRLPLEVAHTQGSTHLTKIEIQERLECEIKILRIILSLLVILLKSKKTFFIK